MSNETNKSACCIKYVAFPIEQSVLFYVILLVTVSCIFHIPSGLSKR